jgi:hypothetical protein
MGTRYVELAYIRPLKGRAAKKRPKRAFFGLYLSIEALDPLN